MHAFRGLIPLIFFLSSNTPSFSAMISPNFRIPRRQRMQIRLPLRKQPRPGHESFTLPDGFGVSVWACEPAVQNPIGMAWDQKGRMWVAENYTYAKRGVRFEMSLRDRVVVLGDEDGDGKAETRKVFTDKVQMLTSVEVGQGGVWLMCPPKLLFIPDADGDLVPDGEPEVRLDGFDVGRGYHNFANGLRWGPDGWLYGRCGHSCPGKPGGCLRHPRRIPRNGPLPSTEESGAITRNARWSRSWLTVRSIHGGTTGTSTASSFSSILVIGHLWHVIPLTIEQGPDITGNPVSGSSQNPLVYEWQSGPAPACRSFSLQRPTCLGTARGRVPPMVSGEDTPTSGWPSIRLIIFPIPGETSF